MTSKEINDGLSRIQRSYGCLALGVPSNYDGSSNAPTRTIFVAMSDASYYALRVQGARPITIATATHAWVAAMEENMTQFEFH